ncbi:MAG: SMP-30/gluconolactonase/LRE family protein [Candidatus Solibacter usitatus]|nr:SMP-30/gluconolactonase/LRE family protein [Candidatus Solibacter usitatus]
MKLITTFALALLLAGCAKTPKEAELLGSDGSWGNTEGPAIDSRGTLYFTSRGTYKGIVSWNEKQGFLQYLAVATGAGPGGLWIDDADNIFVTATNERQILKVTPDKQVSVVAEKFEADPKVAKGPNDLVVAKNGNIYFTDPNGYDGSAPNGTVYSIAGGKTALFSAEVTGPNGIGLSVDEKTLYVSHNINADTSKIVRWPLNNDGSAGKMVEVATVKPCIADGIAVDKEGAMWLTCYSFGTAYRVSAEGKILATITTGQKALTNAKFGRAGAETTLFLTSSDMARVTGYIYRAKVDIAGLR